jgi:hypothetical protein
VFSRVVLFTIQQTLTPHELTVGTFIVPSAFEALRTNYAADDSRKTCPDNGLARKLGPTLLKLLCRLVGLVRNAHVLALLDNFVWQLAHHLDRVHTRYAMS